MEITTPYSLPFVVLFGEHPLLSNGADIKLSITLENKPTSHIIEILDALVLPFFLLATSGALGGHDISPWKSTVKEKSKPSVNNCTIEWILSSCNLDDRSLVIFSQMLLGVHNECCIKELMLSKVNGQKPVQTLKTDSYLMDPYPGIWNGLQFRLTFDDEISREVSVHATFSYAPSISDQQEIEGDLFSWAPGVLSGAYGIAPVAPNNCTAMPNNELVFIDNKLDWNINRVFAHPSAFYGLANVFASISHRIIKVNELLIA